MTNPRLRATVLLAILCGAHQVNAINAFSAAPRPFASISSAAKKTRRPGGGTDDIVAFRTGSASVRRVPRGGDVSSALAAMTPPAALVEACGKVAPVTAILLSLSPLPTVWGITKDKTVGDLPLLPYSSLALNAFIWTTYGVLKREAKLWSCNAVSVVLGLYYFAIFAKHSPPSAPTLPGSVKGHARALAVTYVATVATALFLPNARAAAILGKVAFGICIAFFASPLVALAAVIRTKTAAAIALPLAVATTGNCFAWLVAGIWDLNDFNVWFPNVIGLTFALVQIALKIFYGNGRAEPKMQTT